MDKGDAEYDLRRFIVCHLPNGGYNPTMRDSKAQTLADFDALVAERYRLSAALDQSRALIQERQRGMTHWEGCEQHHSVCAVLKVIESALSPADK